MRPSSFLRVLSIAAGLFDLVLPNEDALKSLFRKMRQDVLEFAREVEGAYKRRCSAETLRRCAFNNYDACLSEYPDQICPGGNQLTIPECGDGKTCGGLFDYSVSTVRIPSTLADGADGNPTDPKVIETVCYSQLVDDWLRNKYFEDRAFWASYGVDSPQMHFGAHDGTFRIYPARHSPSCGKYDPTERPWYIAGSSGPKNIVLVLDTSGSMWGVNGRRLHLMKQAAYRIINTLTVGDRVAIVEFNSNATLTAESDGRMFVATEENKKTLNKTIGNFVADGRTNFYDAFDRAFSTLETSIERESHVSCNSAIIFLTDGEMTEPEGVNDTEVIDMITKRKALVEAESKRPLFIFTYSVSSDPEVHRLPKKIACSTEQGVWSKIDDEEKLVSSMSSYYKLFALGLGEGGNEDFTAWVEPYAYATGGALGTTVSAPVYDRTVSPPLLIGVVGIDFTTAAMDQALGVAAGSSETLKSIVDASTAKCPVLSLAHCELESFRKEDGEEGLCTDECMSGGFVGIEPEACTSTTDLPNSLWTNTKNKGKCYKCRVCCQVGEKWPSDECPMPPIPNMTITEEVKSGDDGGFLGSTGAAVGFFVGISVVVCLAALIIDYICICRNPNPTPSATQISQAETSIGPDTPVILPECTLTGTASREGDHA